MGQRQFSSMFLYLTLTYIEQSNAECACDASEQTFLSLVNDTKNNFALEGHVLETFSVTDWHKCYTKCIKNCQCLTFNFNEANATNNCELNDATVLLAAESLKVKHGVRYYEPVRTYFQNNDRALPCSNGACRQKCCVSTPCQNRGTCHDVCDVRKRRYQCTCPAGYHGYKCHKRDSTELHSCKEIRQTGQNTNGVYTIIDATGSTFSVYCDFYYEPGAAWTLIQSHSLANNAVFQSKPFFLFDMPTNQDAPEWLSYRLSLSRMQHLRNYSTHWRATCNFWTNGIDFRDYARATHGSLDLLVDPSTTNCIRFELLNIRGHNCTQCTAKVFYSDTYTFHVDSYHSSQTYSCQFNGRVGAVSSEDDFGYYHSFNPNFRCSSSSSSTSQFWFGSM